MVNINRQRNSGVRSEFASLIELRFRFRIPNENMKVISYYRLIQKETMAAISFNFFKNTSSA